MAIQLSDEDQDEIVTEITKPVLELEGQEALLCMSHAYFEVLINVHEAAEQKDRYLIRQTMIDCFDAYCDGNPDLFDDSKH